MLKSTKLILQFEQLPVSISIKPENQFGSMTPKRIKIVSIQIASTQSGRQMNCQFGLFVFVLFVLVSIYTPNLTAMDEPVRTAAELVNAVKQQRHLDLIRVVLPYVSLS